MSTDELNEFFNELDDTEQVNNFIRRDQRRQRFPERHFKVVRASNEGFLKGQDDSRRNFKFTYNAARFEEWWLLDSLGDFYEHQWITDVLRRVKGGKEASVYQCRSGGAIKEPYAAAKVYRPRSLRNLKNDGTYREGRTDLDQDGNRIIEVGMQHAMHINSSYGQELKHQSWIAYEFTTMQALFQAGVDVPEVYAMEKNAILMRFIGDDISPAPTLNEISLERKEARTLFERVRRNLELMLTNDVVHGDLSAYNIMYLDGDICLIDFPQVVSPQINRNAFRLFERDVVRVCDYFSKQGLKLEGRKIAAELWRGRGLHPEPEVHPMYLDADDPKDRERWARQ